jgi:hypothetical protein
LIEDFIRTIRLVAEQRPDIVKKTCQRLWGGISTKEWQGDKG